VSTAAEGPVAEGQLLWEASPERKQGSNLVRYQRWLETERGLRLPTYEQLWRWSVGEPEAFWASVWDFFRVESRAPYRSVLERPTMPGARWFPGAELNFAEHVFGHASEARPALLHKREGRPLGEVSWAELRRQVAGVAARLRAMGVGRGDRVAAYLPNVPEAVVAFLACASLGAIWSCCSPDFGPRSVIDRLRQIEPRVLIAADGYRYGGRDFDRLPVVRELQEALPSLERTLLVPNLEAEVDLRGLRGAEPWDPSGEERLEFEAVPFDHPLWILYSSGTTGAPKGIVHGHGGILLDLLVAHGIHFDLKPEDRFFWFTTTGWVMWNIVVSSLLLGCTAVLYDGAPAHPEVDSLWGLVPEAGITFFGTSAGYLGACAKAGAEPGRRHDLRTLRSICYTGSPLAPELWAWSYRHVADDVWFSAVSGGTDVCGPFVGGVPTLPVRAGRFQCRCLGASVEAFDEAGRSVVDQVGELVVTRPMPSMPLYLWNDASGERYRESYFARYPGVWRHGDWIKITSEGEAVIYGRSDATLNRMGVRIGSAEIYRVVEDLPEVVDSLVVDLTALGREGFMPLFVVLREGVELDAELEARIRGALRQQLSPRHVPDAVFPVPEIPRTLNQKKLEVPVRKILLGTPPEQAVDRDAMSNPGSLQAFVELGERLRGRRS
jgi:acetoacetyl-CoA synthetase